MFKQSGRKCVMIKIIVFCVGVAVEVVDIWDKISPTSMLRPLVNR